MEAEQSPQRILPAPALPDTATPTATASIEKCKSRKSQSVFKKYKNPHFDRLRSQVNIDCILKLNVKRYLTKPADRKNLLRETDFLLKSNKVKDDALS